LEDILMEYTYEQLKKKTVAELRAIAREVKDEAVQGYSQMNKAHLLPALCKGLGIDAHEHHAAHGIGKAKIKARIKDLKSRRAKIFEASPAERDRGELQRVRREIHRLKHKLRAAAV
jgi:DNA-binding IclR family transcriptional regulator